MSINLEDKIFYLTLIFSVAFILGIPLNWNTTLLDSIRSVTLILIGALCGVYSKGVTR
jgi:hypothetical protein